MQEHGAGAIGANGREAVEEHVMMNRGGMKE